jgi:alcohol dehydrogenase class IV
MPHTLADLGVPASARDQVAAMAVVDPTAATNPVPLTIDGATSIFAAAFDGRV